MVIWGERATYPGGFNLPNQAVPLKDIFYKEELLSWYGT